jgi:hypothetical protein
MSPTSGQSFDEPWVKRFPNGHAEAVAVALRYRGNVVQQWTCILVDGERYCVLMPDITEDGFALGREKLPLARLLFALHDREPLGAAYFDNFLRRAGIRVA